jgi:hypothetical protein
MVQGSHHFQFTLETLKLRRIAKHGLVGDFDYNVTMIHKIVSAIDLAHPARGQMFLDLELVKLIADLKHPVRYYNIAVHHDFLPHRQYRLSGVSFKKITSSIMASMMITTQEIGYWIRK